ncbi:High-affinity branched-chain amino acid transport ATP-binding protein LivF [Paraburkholderia nemoris]|jgi:ABC-type branched-chain amino acid transport systems, ATPase component|uniref:ABC transporter ATP-binding protein n=1 Tax=Paraburkholderia nemoris TaxID=2793076 RepID=UPI001909C279|nr:MULTISPECIES: ABC transporter ATP-binding protein [Paraburkholderia]MBK3782522.1 ABC transporter ATP-binding protein [Paraburkholderia aspalathi]CAE6736621.1 High-affinity branched-chain amino acid transport ATP-binding protein LivF [Paraburkholderia nemoris]CAE6748714.1 High-affinity branched-chain amino acid transport ATP-binding protein LivF [Paraburkholderia nemoris]
MSAAPILQVDDIAVTYSQLIPALRGVSLTVPSGAIVALLGGNGAGKTTTLKAISNLIRAERGELTSGRIAYRGDAITDVDPWTLAERGLVQVLEGRRCFAHLSVEQNLRLGAFVRRPARADLEADLERIYGTFPRLKERRKALAGYTSGGEQQMVAIGRALMARPSLVLLDEPSMGLAPQVVEEIFETVAALNRDDGVSFLLAEQNAAIALQYAQSGYVLEGGRVVAHGKAEALLELDTLRDAYLGRGQSATGSTRRGSRHPAP